MFSQLTFPKFHLVEPLFATLSHYVTLQSVFAGLTPGMVFADDMTMPKTAVITYNHRVYLAGDPAATSTSSVNHFFRETFLPILQQKEQGSFVLNATPVWETWMPKILQNLNAIRRQRHYYRLDARQHVWQPQLPDQVSVRAVNAALLADESITNLDFVTEEMVSERPSLTDFLEKSFGYCAIHNHKVVGWCMSEYNTGSRCELGIATVASHQRQGVAMALATAVIQHALTVGIHDIGWVCWADNLPSVTTAKKLGFEVVAETAVWQT
jgi:RimJ/RimL family protein N-acetyltransferase